MGNYFTTPIGRIVQGNPNVMQANTDDFGKPKMKADGTPSLSLYVGIAIAKNDPEWPAFHAGLVAEARSAWPQFFNAAGQCTHPAFAWKIIDGDGVGKKGQAYSRNEGFAGHWVIKLSSNFARPCFSFANGGWYQTDQIKCGDYVQASFEYTSNAPSKSEGMYANLDKIALHRIGDAIVITSGPSPEQAFKAPLASPAAPALGLAPAAPGAPASPTAAPSSPPPYNGYMAPPPAAPAGPTMLPAAGGHSYESYLASGWTHAQLVANGMVAA